MKILEFTGAPGIGKSTLCQQLENVLIQQGYKVINLQRYLPGDTFHQKVYRKYRYHMIWHAPINRNMVTAFRNLNFPMDSVHREWMERILFVNYQLHMNGEAYDYILMDEGMIQFITSLYHTKELQDAESVKPLILALCPEYLQNTKIIYMTLNLLEVCQRLKHRNRAGDRFVMENQQQMIQNLEKKLKNIDFAIDASGIPVYHLKCDNVSNAMLVQDIINHCL